MFFVILLSVISVVAIGYYASNDFNFVAGFGLGVLIVTVFTESGVFYG